MIPEDDFGDYRSPWDLSGTPMPGESTNVWHVVRLDVESPLPIYMNKAIEREIAKMVFEKKSGQQSFVISKLLKNRCRHD